MARGTRGEARARGKSRSERKLGRYIAMVVVKAVMVSELEVMVSELETAKIGFIAD